MSQILADLSALCTNLRNLRMIQLLQFDWNRLTRCLWGKRSATPGCRAWFSFNREAVVQVAARSLPILGGL
jgi:hypothetical protein